ncbi:hypothetical protein [Pleionea sediminis]|uniref:hypothetical protein n=1 Tax=Pleionea sediminis TaxID=2569479 RepID=UPI001186B7CE|nr:hypothetical protein [Pleionea sediminis]
MDRKYKWIAVLLLSHSALATEYEYSLGTSGSSSTNVTQRPDGQEGSVYQADLTFDISDENLYDWQIDFASSLSRLNYDNDELADETRSNIRLESTYQPKDTNFSLMLFGDLSQVPANRFQTEEVNNLRDSQTVAFSPNYFVRLDSQTDINLNYQHIDYQVEDSGPIVAQVDNSRTAQSASFSLNRQINATNRLSLVLQETDNDYDNDEQVNTFDFRQSDQILRWVVVNATNEMQLDLGNSNVDGASGQKASEEQMRFSWNRQMNSRQSVTLELFEGVANLININAASGTISINPQANALFRAQRSESGTFQYEYNTGLVSFRAQIFETNLFGIFADNDEIRRGHDITLSTSLSRLLSSPLQRLLTFRYSDTETDFNIIGNSIEENRIKQSFIRYDHVSSSTLSFYSTFEKREAKQLDRNLGIIPNTSEYFTLGFVYRDRGQW